MLATPEKMIFIAGIFLLAGIVKGVVGMGLPVVAMGALALIMPSVEAAVLLIVPSLITNIWQFATGPSIRKITIRLAWMMVFLCVGTALGIQLLTQKNVSWPSVALGLVLVLYALSGLAFPGLSVPSRMESRSPAYFSDRGRSFQRDRGRYFRLIVDAQGCAQARK